MGILSLDIRDCLIKTTLDISGAKCVFILQMERRATLCSDHQFHLWIPHILPIHLVETHINWTIYKENIPQTLESPEYLGLSLQQMLVVLDTEFPFSLFTEILFVHCIASQIYNKTYLLTPWCRVLLENLTGFQLVKK